MSNYPIKMRPSSFVRDELELGNLRYVDVRDDGDLYKAEVPFHAVRAP